MVRLFSFKLGSLQRSYKCLETHCISAPVINPPSCYELRLLKLVGHDQAKIGMELIKAKCKMNKFDVPVGWAIGAKKGAAAPQQVTFKDISSDINASLMYLESQAGLRDVPDWVLTLKASQQFADACGRQTVVSLADLASTDSASMILMGYQCIKLQGRSHKEHTSIGFSAGTLNHFQSMMLSGKRQAEVWMCLLIKLGCECR